MAAVVPGLKRQPRKKLGPDPDALLALLQRWRGEAIKAGRPIARLALAYEAGRDDASPSRSAGICGGS